MSISINTVQNFDLMSVETASRILYNQIIPQCEAKGIKLSSYGNLASRETLIPVERYDTDKQEHRLFNVERIQRAFTCLHHFSSETLEAVESYVLKLILEKHQDEPISNGDCIAAMLMKGYLADFRSESQSVNCRFILESNK